MTVIRRPAISVRRVAVAVPIGLLTAVLVILISRSGPTVAPGSFPLSGTPFGIGLWIAAGAVPAAVIGLLGPATAASAVARGLLVGLLWWVLWPLTLLPLARGDRLSWDSAAVAAGFPDLIAIVLQAGATGLIWAVVATRIWSSTAPEHAATETGSGTLPRILVLGGGFAGVAVARRLERLARRRARWDVTLVSDSNFLLFTPMLAEVAGGAVQAAHVGAALRAACPRTRFRLGRVAEVDLSAQTVRVGAELLAYDHVVLALGSAPSFHELPGIAEHCLTLKSLPDAARVREHTLTQLERADATTDTEQRRGLLTFAVIGGGFAGVELVAQLRDLTRSVLRYFPALDGAELRFLVVHSGKRILPEISPELAAVAAEQLRASGVEIILDTRVRGAVDGCLLLADGAEVAAATMVWTAGNQPHSVARSLPAGHSRPGGVLVDRELRIIGWDGAWAAGDCAGVPDGPDALYPPTAQHALREGRQLADNLAAVLDGREPRPFSFTTLGTLAALGHRTGVAEIRGRRFSGVLAWAMWRVIYLAKLPGLEKRVRVALDWLLEMGFPRDVVVARESAGPAPTPPSPVPARPESPPLEARPEPSPVQVSAVRT